MSINRRRFLGGSAAIVAAAGLSRAALSAQFNYKLAHSTPARHPFSLRLAEASKSILEQTSGRLNIQLFPAGQLGGDTALLSQVRTGAIEFFPAAGLILASVLPVAAVDGMGFAFPSYQQVWPAMDGDLGAYVRKQIVAKAELIPMDKMWDLGYRQITNSVRPIKTVADVQGMKLRVPGAPALVSMFQALGTAPVSMDFGEVYTALQTKVVDGQENPLSQIDSGKFYEVQKYLSLTNHVWDGFWILANGAAWKRLPEDIRSTVNQVFDEKALLQRADLVTLNKSLVDELTAKSMLVNTPEITTFRARLKEAGFYASQKQQIGQEAWQLLENYVGPLG
jgi:TRAP-type transport system periplasmic protein